MAVQVGTQNRRITMASRPVGFPTEDDFAFDEVEIGEPGPGQVLVRRCGCRSTRTSGAA